MSQTFLSLIAADGREQTVEAHCRNTAEIAAKALLPIGLSKTAFLAGLLHDTGKFKKKFTEYLREAVNGENAIRGSINHTFAGVRYLLEQWHTETDEFGYSDVTAELLAYAVGGHHGLFDCIGPNRKSGFFHRQAKEGIGYEESVRNYLKYCADKKTLGSLFLEAVQEVTPILDRIAQIPCKDPLADEETMF